MNADEHVSCVQSISFLLCWMRKHVKNLTTGRIGQAHTHIHKMGVNLNHLFYWGFPRMRALGRWCLGFPKVWAWYHPYPNQKCIRCGACRAKRVIVTICSLVVSFHPLTVLHSFTIYIQMLLPHSYHQAKFLGHDAKGAMTKMTSAILGMLDWLEIPCPSHNMGVSIVMGVPQKSMVYFIRHLIWYISARDVWD